MVVHVYVHVYVYVCVCVYMCMCFEWEAQTNKRLPMKLSDKWLNRNTSSFTDAAYSSFTYLW